MLLLRMSANFFSGKSFVSSTELMEKMNNMTEFILLGLTQNMELQKFSFLVFLIVYLVTLASNLLIMITISTSKAWDPPCASSCLTHLLWMAAVLPP